jgi:PAS domain S-box-containing protein
MILEGILAAAAIFNYVLVAIILLRTRPQQAGRNFAWYLLGIGTWTFIAALLLHPGLTREHAIVLMRLTYPVATLFSVAWVWFCAGFPTRSARYRIFAAILTILGLPWLLIAGTPLLLDSITGSPWYQHGAPGPLAMPFGVWVFTCGFSGLLHLAFKQRRERGFEREQIRYILLGGASLILLAPIPTLILPLFMHDSAYAPLGPVATLFVSITTTYAIVRYRLMDIKIVLRASLVYSLTLAALSLLFALLVPVLNHLIITLFRLPEHAGQQVGTFLMAFLVALAFQPLRGYVQNLVDQRFFKSVYDYRLTLREAGSAFASARDREGLTATLLNALMRALRPRGIAVLLPADGDILTVAATTQPMPHLPPTLPQHNPVLHFAATADEVLVADEYLRMPEPQHSLGATLHAWGVDVIVPLTAGDRLCGMVCLQEKLSADMYTGDDIALLRILGKQAAIALDNVRHYDEIVLLNEYHTHLLETMQDGLVAIDPDARVLTFNKAAERITGIAADDALGRSLPEIGLPELPSGIAWAGESTLALRDGSEIPILVTISPFRRRWDATDSHLIVFRDISELRALEQEKMQTERFSSMGAMAASLAHEIKNPLVPIQTFAHLLPTRYDDAEFRQEFSHTVVKEVERINRLVGQMLDLVRKPSDDPESMDIREIIQRVLVLVRPECDRAGVAVVTDFGDPLPDVQGVAGQLYQAILNVLTNAVQAMPDGGTLTIAVQADGDMVRCAISDTGPGVSADELPRIFEPLYTTKTGGHGLGLALTYQFVRSHGGEIHADTPPDAGLRITLVLPVAAPQKLS